ITIEDVIEQIVGEIEDEHDVDEGSYILEHDGQFTVKAATPVEDINEALKTRFDAEEADTIGGVVMNAFGHMPKREESILIEGLRFTVLRSDNRRIYLLRISREEEDLNNREGV
ncbi:MAG TPA: magnesium/cobalt efflux protein, partial [Gammaproteobacteria bacterium]|nr:magnesium/cobalt efflux protein [Gammaproteobacteria bacterium]